MIKIIKPGKQKIYHATCKDCGCEFTYEGEDRRSSTLNPGLFYVMCPCCGEPVYEDFIIRFPNGTTSSDCETCPNRDGYKDSFGNPVVGDSPCDFCPKNPMKVTCISSPITTGAVGFYTNTKGLTIDDVIVRDQVRKVED